MSAITSLLYVKSVKITIHTASWVTFKRRQEASASITSAIVSRFPERTQLYGFWTRYPHNADEGSLVVEFSYLSSEHARDFDDFAPEEVSGLGVSVTRRTLTEKVTLLRELPNGARANLSGDLLKALDELDFESRLSRTGGSEKLS